VVCLRVLSRRNLSHPSRRSSPKPRRLILLQTLCHRQKSQPLWNQAIPHSFDKTPGVGVSPSSVPLCLPVRQAGLCVNPDVSLLVNGCKNAEIPSLTTFRINTCKSVSNQRTLTTFRMNTYAKQGEGGSTSHGSQAIFLATRLPRASLAKGHTPLATGVSPLRAVASYAYRSIRR